MIRTLFLAACGVGTIACGSPAGAISADAATDTQDAGGNVALSSALEELTMRVNGRLTTLTIAQALSISGARGVSIAVVHPGQDIETFVLGDSGAPRALDPDTLFQAASISKAVTAFALHAENDTSWQQEDVRTLVPELESSYPISVDGLLSHSAGATVHGFPGYEEGQALPTLPQILLGDGNSPRVLFQGGGGFSYSGGGYVALQLFLERRFGEDLEVFVRRNLLQPSGSERVTFAQPILGSAVDYAACGEEEGASLGFCRNVYPEQAAAGLWTTPRDLVRIARFITEQRPELLARATRQVLETERGAPQIGLGIFVAGQGEERAYQHDGANAGFCSAWLFFADGRALAVMENSCTGLASGVRFGLCRFYGWTCD